jgi:hypothetical protein
LPVATSPRNTIFWHPRVPFPALAAATPAGTPAATSAATPAARPVGDIASSAARPVRHTRGNARQRPALRLDVQNPGSTGVSLTSGRVFIGRDLRLRSRISTLRYSQQEASRQIRLGRSGQEARPRANPDRAGSQKPSWSIKSAFSHHFLMRYFRNLALQ